jgi:murein DD-endopeptidase MepM/ murein hydrolase activator NlpD
VPPTLGVAALCVLAAACAARQGIYHDVRRGENLYRIGKAYGVPFATLARVNDIRDPHRIAVGQRIFVPRASRHLPVGVITPELARADRPLDTELPRGARPFMWPLASGHLSSGFGPRGESFHDGIDVSAPEGTAVRAARDGEVIYSDQLRGYGNVVILRHDGGYATVYAHNAVNLVVVGSHVRQGDLLAKLGRTGKTSGPNLHFEVRKDNVARNPLYYLPPLPGADQVVAGGL